MVENTLDKNMFSPIKINVKETCFCCVIFHFPTKNIRKTFICFIFPKENNFLFNRILKNNCVSVSGKKKR